MVGVTCPKQMIPFKVNRKQMESAFKAWTKGGRLTPSDFTSQNTIDKITGLYAPYWMFDYHTKGRFEAHCENIRMMTKGDTEYTYTRHYEVIRDLEVDYDKLPLDASKRLDDDMMDKLEPFNCEDLKPFSMEYLSGFQSERYDETDEDLKERGEKRIIGYINEEANRNFSDYQISNIVKREIEVKKKKVDYILLPVWLLNYKYNGKNYTFALNGQTGKIVGDLPISKTKALKWHGLIFGMTTIICMLIGGFIW
ncbi:YdjG [Lachnospiraceae bacterium TWA4]|nr:YdjG [Lachnospiraceae bacterium TWA4]